MELDGLPQALAAHLTERGVPARVSWPGDRRTGPEQAVVLVDLEQVKCSGAGLAGYLGQRLEEQTGMWEEVYGRRAELTFSLDICASPQAGAGACRELFARTAEALGSGRVLGLGVKSLTGGEPGSDSKEGLLKLEARLVCEGWLCAGPERREDAFLDFTLRGDMNG